MGNRLQIGSRVLMGSTVRCCFHHTSAVLNNIEVIRAIASEKSAEFNRKLREYPNEAIVETRSFNNAISIVGSRGSGKTSVILTLQRILQNDSEFADDCSLIVEEAKEETSKRNIIMPILIPQDCSPEQSLLSWIVSQLIEKARKIEKQENENSLWSRSLWNNWVKESNRYIHESPLRTCVDDLIKAYELKCSGGHIESPGTSEEVYYYMDAVKRDSSLITNMLKLISMIVDYYKFLSFDISSKYCPDKKRNNEPLIIFTIDDLDLAPQRSHEVIELVQRYLQHPNVVVICGWNQELFQNHLCIELLRMQGVLTADQVNESFTFDDVFMKRYRKHTSALDSARRLAMDNLKKAFPPSQRYEIRSLSNIERANFPLGPKELESIDTDRLPTLFELIDRTIAKCKYFGVPVENPSKTDFLYENGDANKPLNVYMRIFDNKARGVTNVYRAFEALGQSLDSGDGDITYQITILFDAILSSNTKFAPYRRGIRDLVQIRKVQTKTEASPGMLEYNCNFHGVNSLFEEYNVGKDNTSYMSEKEVHAFERKYEYFPKVIIDVYLLLNFMENMLRHITGQSSSEHGGLSFSKALNVVYPPIKFSSASSLNNAIRLNGITKLDFFPETAVFKDNVALLNSYENEGLEERGYSYTGYNTLKSILKILAKKCKDKEASTQFNNNNPEWVSSVVSICESLQPVEKNIFRLAAYESAVKQNAEWVAIDEFSLKNQVDFTSYKDSMFGGEKENIMPSSNQELDSIVKCIRLLASNKKRFDEYIIRKDRNQKLSEDFGIRAILFAKLLHEMKTELSKIVCVDCKDKPYIRDLSKFADVIKPLSDFKVLSNKIQEESTSSDENDIDIVKRASKYAEELINNLLHDLKVKLLNNLSFVAAKYKSDKELLSRYQMLLRVSPAIGNYYRLWNLLEGAWSENENIAVAKLEIYFDGTERIEPHTYINQIKQLGPKIHEKQRNVFIDNVYRLKQWYETHESQFTHNTRKGITNCIDILLRAPEHMVRNIGFESDIQEVLREVGKRIEFECGLAAVKAYYGSKAKIDKSKNEDALLAATESCNMIWPIPISHQKSLSEYSEVILTIRKPIDTLIAVNSFEIFDLNLYKE